MRRRISKMKCRPLSSTNKTRKLPAFYAASCPGKTRKGRDGTYESVEATNGTWVWKKKMSGGFAPSIMGGVVRVGSYAVTAAIAQGSRLIRNNKKRMASRRHGRSRVRHTRHNKRRRNESI